MGEKKLYIFWTIFRRMHRKLVTRGLQERELSSSWRKRWKTITFVFEFVFQFLFYFEVISNLRKSCKNKIEQPSPGFTNCYCARIFFTTSIQYLSEIKINKTKLNKYFLPHKLGRIKCQVFKSVRREPTAQLFQEAHLRLPHPAGYA